MPAHSWSKNNMFLCLWPYFTLLQGPCCSMQITLKESVAAERNCCEIICDNAHWEFTLHPLDSDDNKIWLCCTLEPTLSLFRWSLELKYITAELKESKDSVNTEFLSVYFRFTNCLVKVKKMQIVLDLKADKGGVWFVRLLRCSAALVTLSESCETLLYHFVPPAWLWNLLSRNMRAATLTKTRFLMSTLRTLPVVGVEDTSPAHSPAVTEFRGLTTH